MTFASAETARLWEQLLQFLEEGRVIPIVGPDLLTLSLEGRDVALNTLVAERLAQHLHVPKAESPTEASLNEVACRYLAEGGELEDIYSAIKSVMPAREELPLPERLLKLAAIEPFKLFVTTTFDPLLEYAINQVRFGGQSKTQVLAHSPLSTSDLPCEMQRLERPVVYHLFGRLSAVPDYAVTDEDVLEFMHSLQSETRRPQLLFDELNRRHLLIMGSSFSDWLARFFIRMGKRERLSLARGKTDVVADARLRDDPGLVLFLQTFSARTKVFRGTAGEFVDELHSRWSERHAAARPQPTSPAEPQPTSLDMEPGAVFLSYASEDLAAVEGIKRELERAGVDVWFDKQALRGGDDYEARIKSNIEKCSLFVPVISGHTLTSRRRFFRLEWDHAEKVAVQVPPSMRFIVPVAIDDTGASEPTLPERFRKLHWMRLPEARPTEEFVASVRQLYREYQKSVLSAP